MMNKITIALLTLASFTVNADYIQAHDPHVVAPLTKICEIKTDPTPPVDPTNYYAGTNELSGLDLKTKLNQIISANTVKLPYSSSSFDVWDALDITDEDPENPNNVVLMYTGRSQAKGQKSGQGNLGQDNWNREHSYPKSNGGFNNKGAAGYTDIHHLRPTDESINSERGNLEYDNGGSLTNESPEAGNRKTATSFEPRDEVKGDVARMMFYMATRYEGHDANTPDLELVPTLQNNGTALGNVCTLLTWHAADPVNDFESKRNDKIFGIQKNRNPYIDHPEWAEEIFRSDCN